MPSGEYWTAAAEAFTSDVYFAGGDGGRTVNLGDGRIMWGYGDSFIRTSPGQARSAAPIVRNCVSIQSGSTDLSVCTMTFYCGGGGLGSSNPGSFYPERVKDGASVWNWPGPGVMLDDVLLLLLSRMEMSFTGFQFANVGWDAVLVDNPQDDPDEWSLNYLDVPSDFLLTYSGSLRDPGDGWVYAEMAGPDVTGNQRLYALRWDRDLAKIGDLGSVEYWCGTKFGWSYYAPRVAIYEPSNIGGAVDLRGSDYLIGEMPSFGGSNYMTFAVASQPTGPFTDPKRFFTPYGSDPNLTLSTSSYLVYGGGFHPEQTWEDKGPDDVLATYAVNGAGGHNVRLDEGIYYMRPVKGIGIAAYPHLPTSMTFPSRTGVASG